jgi:hypothetical protein
MQYVNVLYGHSQPKRSATTREFSDTEAHRLLGDFQFGRMADELEWPPHGPSEISAEHAQIVLEPVESGSHPVETAQVRVGDPLV